VPTGSNAAVMDKGDTVVVTADGGTDTFDTATGNPRR
jgi:hypothetical protein